MAEFLLTSSIDPIKKGDRFEKSLPRHVTIQQYFELELQRPFENALQNYATTVESLEIQGVEDAMFGPENDVPVRRTTLGQMGRLARLHADTKELLERFGGELKRQEWAGSGFKPHVTYVDGFALDEGETATLRTLELIKRDEKTGDKTVELVVPFSKGKR